MVRFEFGARPVDPAASAEHIRVCSGCGQSCLRPVFNDPARARWVRFAKSLFLAAQAGVVKPRQPLRGLVLSDTIFRIFESTAVAGSGVLALLVGLPLVEFSRLLGRFRIHFFFCLSTRRRTLRRSSSLLKRSRAEPGGCLLPCLDYDSAVERRGAQLAKTLPSADIKQCRRMRQVFAAANYTDAEIAKLLGSTPVSIFGTRKLSWLLRRTSGGTALETLIHIQGGIPLLEVYLDKMDRRTASFS